MVRTCSHMYPSGKTCGRIPRRGENLCRDHRRAAPPEPGLDPHAFNDEMFRECDRLAGLPLDQILLAAQEHCIALQGFIERRASPRLHAHHTKLNIALTNAIDRLLAQPRFLAGMLSDVPPEQIATLIAMLWRAEPEFVNPDEGEETVS